jgi:hypothetical protein
MARTNDSKALDDSEELESSYFNEMEDIYKDLEPRHYETTEEIPDTDIKIGKGDYSINKPRRISIIARIIND